MSNYGIELPAAALSDPIAPRPNDLYDAYDPITPTPQQRQQQRRTHIEAVSAGISPSPPRVRFARQGNEPVTHDFDEDFGTSTPVASSTHLSPQAERRPHRALRISKNTASAILYTLEEALRHPNPFTPDLVEENASMSDLIGGGPSTSASNGRTGNGRTQAAPGTTGSPSIRGPRDIMRDRAARERRKAEDAAREEMERAHAEEEARLIEENKRRVVEMKAAAGAANQTQSGEGNQRGSGGVTGQRLSDNSQRSERKSVIGWRAVEGPKTKLYRA